MLLDMYLFFSLPFPLIAQPKAAPRPGRGTGKRVASGAKTASPRVSRRPEGSRGKRRTAAPTLRVIDGGRAGIP